MRKRTIIGLIAVIITIIIVFLISKPKKINDLGDILKKDRLTVLIESGVYGFTRDSLQVYGFQYEIIKAFTDTLGVELVLTHQQDNKSVYKKLYQGEYDVLVSLKPIITDSLASVVSLRPILNSRLILVQHSQAADGKMIRKQYELNGDTLYVTKASAFTGKLNFLLEDLAIDVVVMEIPDVHTADLVQMVNEQKIKYTFCPEYLSERFKQDYPDLNFSLALSFSFDLAWSINRESQDLTAKLNEFLEEFVDSQEFFKLKEKYHIQ